MLKYYVAKLEKKIIQSMGVEKKFRNYLLQACLLKK